MLTDLTFLQQGKRWPPPSEANRLNDYAANRKLFENLHSEVYREQMKRIERVIGNFARIVSFPVIFNYQRLMSIKIADLIFGEPPSITIADGDSGSDKKQKLIDRILLETGLFESAYAAALDVSRYGDGLLMVSKRSGGKPAVDVTTPAIWFPVVDKANIKHTLYHVLGYHYLSDESRREWNLRVQLHKTDEPGKCEERTYRLTGAEGSWNIGAELPNENPQIDTQLAACPVFRVPNMLTSDRVFGIDDYEAVDSIISELIVRVSQISKVLDVHANPSMSGPESALEQDPDTKQWRLRVGDYFPRVNKDDPAPEYIIWDASLDANFKQIELLVNQLYTISEMGSAIFGDLSNSTGQVPSGSALRRLMMSPLSKARRIANKFDPVLKQLVSLCASVYGTEIAPQEISISWNDGLPDDEAEAAGIMAVRTGNKATISQFSAIKRLDKLSSDDAQSELEQIHIEAAADAPEVLTSIDSHEEEPTEGGEE